MKENMLYWTQQERMDIISCQYVEEETEKSVRLVNWSRAIPKEHIGTKKPYYGKFWFRSMEECEAFLKDSKSYKSTYQLLDRLLSDCKYWLDEGRNDSVLWAKNPKDQIEKMRELYEQLPEDMKPMWLSREDIDRWAEVMGVA